MIWIFRFEYECEDDEELGFHSSLTADYSVILGSRIL